MGPSEEYNLKYVITIKDEIVFYIWLSPCDKGDRDTATTNNGKRINRFGGRKRLVTDQSSYLGAYLMSCLASDLHIKHHFMTAYFPWLSDTADSVRKKDYVYHAQNCQNRGCRSKNGHQL